MQFQKTMACVLGLYDINNKTLSEKEISERHFDLEGIEYTYDPDYVKFSHFRYLNVLKIKKIFYIQGNTNPITLQKTNTVKVSTEADIAALKKSVVWQKMYALANKNPIDDLKQYVMIGMGASALSAIMSYLAFAKMQDLLIVIQYFSKILEGML